MIPLELRRFFRFFSRLLPSNRWADGLADQEPAKLSNPVLHMPTEVDTISEGFSYRRFTSRDR